MIKIFHGKQKVMEVARGVSAGYRLDGKTVTMSIAGEISLDEVLDLLHTLEYEFLTTFVKNAEVQNADVKDFDIKKIKKQVYDRSVMGYSLMIDKFYPQKTDELLHNQSDKGSMSKV